MDKIPGSSQPSSLLQPESSDISSTGKLGDKQVNSTDPKPYLDKTTKGTPDQTLVNRQITSHSLNMMVRLGQEQSWEALSSAIHIYADTQTDLTHILDSLQQHNIDIPVDIQNQICLRFSELTALIKAVILKSKLPASPIEEHAVLAIIADHPERHDSPIGIISRKEVDDFIKTHKLSSANREHIVQDMSERMYLMTTERMKAIEEEILIDTPDSTLKKQIQNSQNERRIEENYRKEISIKS